MAQIPPKADSDRCSAKVVSGVPIAVVSKRSNMLTNMATDLLDHLDGTCEEGDRGGESERFGSLEVNQQLIFGRRLHRQIGCLLTP